jgi:hypothetical protein
MWASALCSQARLFCNPPNRQPSSPHDVQSRRTSSHHSSTFSAQSRLSYPPLTQNSELKTQNAELLSPSCPSRVSSLSRPSRPAILLVSRAEQAEQTQREACAIFADGLTAFRNRAWGQARATFQQCIDFTGKDGPSQFYLTLCDQYLKTPPQKNPGPPSSR